MELRNRVNLLDAGQLRQLQRDTPHGDVLLVDVREPAEYQEGHIPGAQLIPLLRLEERIKDLRPAAHTVFYCHTGQRSLRAAAQVVMTRNLPNIYTLEGGILGWQGRTLAGVPNLRAFDGAGALGEVIARAMDMEKGAMRLYESLLSRFVGTALEAPLMELVSAELAHLRALYRLLERQAGPAAPPFEELYAGLGGEIMESGEEISEVVRRLARVEQSGPPALLETALELELRAYDLYSKLAHREQNPGARRVFKELAAQEDRHARMVLRGLEALAAQRASGEAGGERGREA